MLSKFQTEQLVRILGQIVLDILVMGSIIYLFHFVFYYPKIWLSAVIVFSVLLRTGWWERMETWVESRRRTKSPRV